MLDKVNGIITNVSQNSITVTSHRYVGMTK